MFAPVLVTLFATSGCQHTLACLEVVISLFIFHLFISVFVFLFIFYRIDRYSSVTVGSGSAESAGWAVGGGGGRRRRVRRGM